MTSEQIAALSGIVISLVFSYVPGASGAWAKLEGTQKRLLMALAMLLVAGLATGLSCAKVIASVDCTQQGVVTLLTNFIVALMANQAVFAVSPQRK